MSQRVVLGPYSKRPIAVVREHGQRVEIIGLLPWVVPQALEWLVSYWNGDWAPHSNPEWSTLESFR